MPLLTQGQKQKTRRSGITVALAALLTISTVAAALLAGALLPLPRGYVLVTLGPLMFCGADIPAGDHRPGLFPHGVAYGNPSAYMPANVKVLSLRLGRRFYYLLGAPG